MSESNGRPSSVSSVSSISLVEIKAESRLVLQAFLHRTLSVPLVERPGRVGGAYKDHNKYSASFRSASNAKDGGGGDSQAEDVSSSDEKKRSGLKDLFKQRRQRSSARSSARDGKGSLEKDSKLRVTQQIEDDVKSPSTSEEDDDDRKQSKKLSSKRIRRKLNRFFRKKLEKDKDKDKDRDKDNDASRPTSLPLDATGEPTAPAIISPNHPPEFYDEVAEKLEKIAQRTSTLKRQKPTPTPPPPCIVCDKDAVVKQLVQVLCSEGDYINTKIQTDPSLRSNLARLSYGSYARLLDAVSSSQVSGAPPLPPAASPTLRRMAVTMEVSRRIVTATGIQRMEGYAESYMESFAPWLKSQGGWENVVDLSDTVEYD